MVTAARVRELALALPEATEQDHHGRPSFRVGKIFATLWTGRKLNVMVDHDGILTAVSARPDACTELYWGKRLAAVQVDLDVADDALVGDLLTDAWEHKAPERLRRAR